MKSMNLFGGSKSKEYTKPRKKEYSKEFKELAANLASKIGVTKAAEELRISTSSIYSWQKTFGTPNLAKSSASIQDEEGNLTFTLEGKTYSLNVNSEEERERVKEEVNANSLAKYDWFKEGTGENHWVLYDTEMYEIEHTAVYWKFYLHYKEDSNLVPVIPINATSCRCMFCDCSKLTSLDIRNFDTSSVIDMSYMFKNCSKLTSLDFSNFDTSSVIAMNHMFYNCKALIQLDLSNFITSKVTDMSYMFSSCERLTSLDLSNFDTNKVTAMNNMFSNCSSLTTLDLSNFNTSKVTAMRKMFCNCKSLITLDLINFDTSNVTYMSWMLGYCISLTSLDLSNFDTSQVTDMSCMFYHCKNLTDIYVSYKWNTDEVTIFDSIFFDCTKLPNFNEEKTNVEMAKPVEQGGYLILKI